MKIQAVLFTVYCFFGIIKILECTVLGVIKMSYRNLFCSSNHYIWHKGFYNDDCDPTLTLASIKYYDFFEYPDDEEFPYYSAEQLLRGSCNHFALSLKNVFNYTPYIIEGINKVCFHAFCQIYKNKKWYYVDARGITDSFDEFMSVAKEFVSSEYVIRPVNDTDISEWEDGSRYNDEAYAFSEAVIEKYRECYEI